MYVFTVKLVSDDVTVYLPEIGTTALSRQRPNCCPRHTEAWS